jgi:hypothetical protein
MPETIEKYIAQKKRHLKSNEKTKKYPGYLGVKCLLSVSDVKYLLKEASITLDQIGRKPHEYQLSRLNDEGDYVLGNCRFVTQKENRSEKDNSAITNHKSIKYDGTVYRSLSEAARITGRHRRTISKHGQFV